MTDGYMIKITTFNLIYAAIFINAEGILKPFTASRKRNSEGDL
jgi:hypothetical protein